MSTGLSKINKTASEIVRMEDLQEVVNFAIGAGALEAAIRRSGKFTGRDYYRVATAVLWAEWRGGQLLQEIERGQTGPKVSSQPANKLGFLGAIDLYKLKKDTAYRWMTMSWVPHVDVAAYFAKQEAATKPLKRSDLVRMGKELRPATVPAVADDYEILHADLEDAAIEEGSVDCIITDPPYQQEFIGEYTKLSTFAARVLKPGGSCFAMAGQSYLPEVMAAMATCLTYHWALAYLTPGGQSVQMWDRHVNTFWKPVLWFVRGTSEGDWVGDVIKSDVNDNDKRFHEWGQSESGFSRLVERFSRPGDLIVDPFVGGGTTAVVAFAQGRRFIGIDRDLDAVKETLTRIARLKEAVA